MKTPLDIFYGVRRRLLKRSVVSNICGAPSSWPKALLHYKTEPFFDPRLVRRYSHTNNWEITEICYILDRAGLQVDVVDRSENNWEPKDEYVFLIGNASGRAGWRYPYYASKLPSALKIFYATGTEAELAKSLMLARYMAFESRTGVVTQPMRVPYNVDIQASIALTDAIICMDGNGFAAESYEKFNLPTFTVVPSTSPSVRYDYTWEDSRESTSFLCFAGNGFIVKGVDLAVEAFSTMPHLTLHIAGPDTDAGFWEAYGSVIDSCPNIVYEGFLDIRSRRFKELCSKCSFVILPASSEAACTSVATAMKAGLVPITTRSTAIDDGSVGYILPSDVNALIDAIVDVAQAVSTMGKNEYKQRVVATRKAAANFSQAGFSATFSQAFHEVLS